MTSVRSLQLAEVLRQQRAIRRMAGGSIDGRAEVAAPLPERPKGDRYVRAGAAAAASLVIAASNSSDAGKEGADYRCDGTNDYETIQLAIDYLAATSAGTGHIHFLEGDFNLGSQGVTVDIPLLLTGSGMGVADGDGTRFNSGGYTAFNCTSGGVTFRDLMIDSGNAASSVGIDIRGGDTRIDGVAFAQVRSPVRFIESSNPASTAIFYRCSVIDCRFYDCGSGTEYLIDLNFTVSQNKPVGLVISRNHADEFCAVTHDLRVRSSSAEPGWGCIISDNSWLVGMDLRYLEGSVVADNFSNSTASTILQNLTYCTITGHQGICDFACTTVASSVISGCGLWGLSLTSCTDVLVSDVYTEDNITLSSCSRCAVKHVHGYFAVTLTSSSDCTVEGCSTHWVTNPTGVVFTLNGSDRCLVTGNRISRTGATDHATAAAIYLTNDSDQNTVTNNMVRALSTGQWQYGCRIDAGCDDNKVTDLDAFGAWVTAAVSDAGTATVLASGNR